MITKDFKQINQKKFELIPALLHNRHNFDVSETLQVTSIQVECRMLRPFLTVGPSDLFF